MQMPKTCKVWDLCVLRQTDSNATTGWVLSWSALIISEFDDIDALFIERVDLLDWQRDVG